MQAAKAGRSTLGIPQSVGAEFVAADKAKRRSSGPFKLPVHKGKSKR
jgi:hypothetical protein